MNKNVHVMLLPSWYPINNNDISGGFFREQALALHNQGYKVGVVAPTVRSLRNVRGVFNDPYGLDVQNDNGVNTYRWHSVNFTPRWDSMNKKAWLSAGEKLFDEYITTHGMPDILHAHSMINGGFLALLLSEKYSIPFVVTEHSSAYAKGLVSRKTIEALHAVIEGSSRNIAVSNAFKAFLNKCFGLESWCYIPNIVSQKFLDAEIEIDDEEMGYSFINVCLFTKNKRVDILIRAFSKAFRNDPRVKLKIGGHGPERDRLLSLVKSEGVKDQVIFLGRLNRDEVMKEISQANTFVLSSEYETFGVVVIEALALGKPVISTRCGGPESIIIPKVGFLIQKNSVTEMAETMRRSYEDRMNFDSVEIRDYCKNNFSELAVVSALGKVYEDVLRVE